MQGSSERTNVRPERKFALSEHTDFWQLPPYCMIGTHNIFGSLHPSFILYISQMRLCPQFAAKASCRRGAMARQY